MDDNVLKYLDDDGLPVESHSMPNYSLVLVNGTKGIGTGLAQKCYVIIQLISRIHSRQTNDGYLTHHVSLFHTT